MQTAAAVSSELVEEGILSVDVEKDIHARQRIYDAVLSGNIDEALSQTDAVAPGTLEKHPKILFRLRCQKFVEMVPMADCCPEPTETIQHDRCRIQKRMCMPPCSLEGHS